MTSTSKSLLTQADYARSRKSRGLPGGTREAVRRAIDEGRISSTGTEKLIDPDIADRQWEANTRLRIHIDGLRVPGMQKETGPVADEVTSEPAYVQLRYRREAAQAEKSEIETAKFNGSMLERDQVFKAWSEIGREFRDQVQTCARRIASEVAGISNQEKCEAVLMREYRVLTAQLTHSLNEKLGTRKGHRSGGGAE